MGTEGGGIAGMRGDHRPSAITTGVVVPDSADTASISEAGRLRAELEQAQVALEDMDHRLAELGRANAGLSERLAEQSRLRQEAEHRAEQLREEIALMKERETAVEAQLRNELSVALEELQVMQEELQGAHDALAVAAPKTDR
jgi:chromosome segregation ATPase